MTDHLAENGDTLAHVVEQVVLALHSMPGHGPQWVDPAVDLEHCPVELCVKWRLYLVSRFAT